MSPPMTLPPATQPLIAWLLTLIDLIVPVRTILIASWLIQFLKKQVTNIAKVTANQVLVYSQTIPTDFTDSFDDMVPF